MISEYDEKIDSLCENFEIDSETINKTSKTSNKQKIMKYLTYSSFIIVILFNGFTIIPPYVIIMMLY